MIDDRLRHLRLLPDDGRNGAVTADRHEAAGEGTLDRAARQHRAGVGRLPAGVLQRHVRSACRYRVATDVVPPGRLVRHPPCPRCGERLAYRPDGVGAMYLHSDDPRYRLMVVR